MFWTSSTVARQDALRLRHLKLKISHTHAHFTHQTPSLYTNIVGADVDAGGPVSDALCLADVETIAGRSAGQLALFVRTNCNTHRTEKDYCTQYTVCLS